MYLFRKNRIFIAIKKTIVGLYFLVWVLSAFSLTHCASPRKFQVGQKDVLVIALYKEITDLYYHRTTENLGSEVVYSDKNGEFEIDERGNSTSLILSKPGFVIKEKKITAEDHEFELEPTKNFHEENRAVLFLENFYIIYCSSPGQKCKKISEHYEQRKSFLESTYAKDFDEFQKELNPEGHYFKERIYSWNDFYKNNFNITSAVPLPHRGLALVSLENPLYNKSLALLASIGPGFEQKLIILDENNKITASVPLDSHGKTLSLIRDTESSIALYDNGSIRRFDFNGQELETIPVSSPPSVVVALAKVSQGYILAFQDENGKPTLSLYDSQGLLVDQKKLSVIREIFQVLTTQNGMVFIRGASTRHFNYKFSLNGMKKKNATPYLILKMKDWKKTEEPVEIFEGADTFFVQGNKIFVYSKDLYELDLEYAIQLGKSWLLRQFIFEISEKGEILDAKNVTDKLVGPSVYEPLDLKAGQVFDGRVVFWKYEEFISKNKPDVLEYFVE